MKSLSCEPVFDYFEATQTLVCVASSSLWWVAPLVIGVSGLAAACISVIAIKSNREIARKRATLDFIERSESTDYYQAAHKAFTEIRTDSTGDSDGFQQIKSPTNPTLMSQRKQVLNYLNHYEMMAIGIKKEILEEDVYKKFMRGPLLRDWLAAKDFIEHLRRPTEDSGNFVSTSSAYCEFEWLADRWQADRIKPSQA